MGPALVAFTMAGCVFPQSDTLLPDPVPELLWPPRIIPETVKPTAETFIPIGENCPPNFTFRVSVDDGNPGDRIRFQFRIDDDPRPPRFGTVEPTDRTKPIEYIAPTTQGVPLGQPTGDGPPHRVRLLISDASLDDNGKPEPDQLADGGLKPAFTDDFLWLVKTRAESCVR